MAPKAAPVAAVISPSAGTASDDSLSPTAPDSVKQKQRSFMSALEEASAESQQKVFPYGITVPFKVRDAVPGDKCASARVFLAEAPIQALKDMCFYLQLEESGNIDDLVSRIVDYFVELFPENSKAASKASRVMQEKLASGPTPVRVRKQSSVVATAEAAPALSAESAPADLKARLTELGKPTYGSRDTLFQRIQEAEAAAQKEEAPAANKKRGAAAEKAENAAAARAEADAEDEKASKKAKTAKPTEKLQKQYCVAGLSIKAQMEMAMKLSMEA